MRSLLSSSCLLIVLLGLSSLSVEAKIRSVPLPHALEMKRKAPVFTATKDGSAGTREGMDWKTAGKTIPMSGGTISTGAFFTSITVGTGNNGAGVTFDTIVDTGSSNTAVPSVSCGSNCGNPTNAYNASDSPTSQKLKCQSAMCQNCIPTAVGSAAVPTAKQDASTCQFGQPTCQGDQCAFGISYGGSGSATEGTTVLDYACLGGVCSNEVYINQFTNQFPAGSQSTGILGLAFPRNGCTPSCQPTFLDVLVDKGVLQPEENMFGMCLTPSEGGVIDLGALNSTRYAAGTMQYTKVVKEHWYNIEVKAMKVNGTALDVPSFLYNIVNDGIGAFADSGTSIVLVSPYTFSVLKGVMLSQFSALKHVKNMFGSGTVATFTAAELATYPEMSFVLAGMDGNADFEVKMTADQYLVQVGGGLRTLGIAGLPSIGAVLGDVIMQNYYINFDRHGGRLGFAPLTPGSC